MTNEKLELNKIYTYAELCETMGEEVAQGGKNRKLQLERIKRLCSYEKPSGQKYKIVAIYDEARIAFNTAKKDLSNYLTCLVINWLIDENEKGNTEPVKTYRELLEDFCLVNGAYYKQRNNKKALAKTLDLPQSYEISDRIIEIARWYDASGDVFSGVIERAIKALRSRSVAEVWQTYRLYREVTIGELTIWKEHDCTAEEIKQIDGIKNATKREMSIETDGQLYGSKTKRNEFNEIVKSRIKAEMGYDAYSRAYRFLSNTNIANAGYFKPYYNQLVVEKMLSSPTMQVVSERINQQLTDGLVKCS